MKVGTVCFSTDQGLGYLARDFHRHGIVTHPVVIAHGRRQDHPEWYPTGTPFIGDYRHPSVFAELSRCNVVLFFETPFDWNLIPRLRERGIKTALMPMHECMPDPVPQHPDLYLCPSLLDLRWAASFIWERETKPGVDYGGANRVFLPVPVDVPWRQRTKCEVFVHNAGNGGLKGRNGTPEVIEAFDKYVKSDAKLLLRAQDHRACGNTFLNPRNTTAQFGTVAFEQLWVDGDCFLFPEKFNGLSLPLQEAHAAGMLVMATDRYPINTWLPSEPLIPVERYIKSRVSPRCVEFDEAVVDPKTIAATIDRWYGRDITEHSWGGKRWAAWNTWEKLGPWYLKALTGLLSP